MKELQYVVYTLGQHKLRAVVNDPEFGVHRRIEVTWRQRTDAPDLPPASWAKGVHGEMEFQRAEGVSSAPQSLYAKMKKQGS